MLGAALAQVLVFVRLVSPAVFYRTATWHYSHPPIWQQPIIYGFDAEGMAFLRQTPPDRARAEDCFRRALRHCGNDFIATLGLARCCQLCGDHQALTLELARLRLAWPGTIDVLLDQSSELAKQAGPAFPLSYLQLASESDWRGEEVLVEIGKLQRQCGDIDAAITSYRQAIKLNPRSLNGHNLLAVVLYAKAREVQQQNKQAAKELYEECARELQITSSIDPNYFPVYMSSGGILFNMGAFDKAELAYRNAIYLKPDNVEARTSMAMVLIRLKRPGDASEQLREALRLDPKSARAHFLYGVILADYDLHDSLEHLQKAVDLDHQTNRKVDPLYERKLAEVKRRLESGTTRPSIVTSP